MDFGFELGLLLGYALDMDVGISIGKKQKPWSELTDSEKQARIVLVATGVVLLVAGVVVFLVRLLT